ncbi:winged helix-turn-helix transcriptional regulator [Bradyrhizobium sp.]|uniref:winged helix-turn-helix transcriptional regulator n=1 Tax=Bradyrhizobium sp. TaxID=376 RepID=UPI0040382AF6
MDLAKTSSIGSGLVSIWQEEQLGAGGANELTHDLAFVAAEIVHDDDISGPKGILSTRLKKFVVAGVMTWVPLPGHAGRYEYVLTEKGRDFFPAYLAAEEMG